MILQNKTNFLPILSEPFLFMCSLLLFKYILGLMFLCAFSCIRTVYREMRRIIPYSVRTRENTDQKKSEHGHFSRSEICFFKVFTVSLRRIEEKTVSSKKWRNILITTSKTVSLLFKSFLQYI